MILIIVCVAVLFSGCAKNEDGWYDDESFDYDITNFTYSNTSSVTISMTFGNDGRYAITDFWVTVSFYNSADNLIATKEANGYGFIDKGEQDTISFYSSGIDGIVAYCELVDTAVAYTDLTISYRLFILPSLIILWLIIVCLTNAKTRYYKYKEHTIKVYAGWYDHYLEIDGKIVDRERTGYAFSVKLNGSIDNVPIRVKIGRGFLGNIITTFIDDEEAISIQYENMQVPETKV
jgi:hypothetical protein